MLLNRKTLKNIGLCAVVIIFAFTPACSSGGTAAVSGEEAASPVVSNISVTSATPSQTQTIPVEDPNQPVDYSKLFEYDSSKPFNVQEVSAEETPTGVKVHEISYDAYDNTINKSGKTTCYVVEPKGEGPFPFVLYLHWYGSLKNNKSEFLDEAKAMAEQGIGGFLIDGYVPWKVKPNGNAEKDKALIIYQVTELRRALDYMVSLPYVDSKNIGYVGHDYGAMFGAVLSGVEKRINSYVLETGMGDFGTWFLKYFVFLNEDDVPGYIDKLSILDPVNFISKAAPAKLFFQFADKDTFISKDIADAFFSAASEPKEEKFYDAVHSMNGKDAREDRDNWLLERLK